MGLARSQFKARDVMAVEPVCVGPSTGIRELARLFEEHEISGAPVVDHQGRVVGVVSKTDLIRKCAEGFGDLPPAYLFDVFEDEDDEGDAQNIVPESLVCVRDLMTVAPLTVGPDEPAKEVARLMFDHRVHRVIVVDEEMVAIGIITSLDLLGALIPHA